MIRRDAYNLITKAKVLRASSECQLNFSESQQKLKYSTSWQHYNTVSLCLLPD